MKKYFLIVLTVWLYASCSICHAVTEAELAKMDIEQLTELNVYSANVLTSHIHSAGEWMFSYKYMHMNMDGNLIETRKVGLNQVHTNYNIAPKSMSVDMHMFNVMYAPTENLTLMLMLPYLEKEMDLVIKQGLMPMMNPGQHFTTKSSGVGDTKASLNYVFFRQDGSDNEAFLTLGLSLPTGSINKHDYNLMMRKTTRLPYPMQLGSGTYDLLLGLGALGVSEPWLYGVQGLGTVPVGKNTNHYQLGNEITIKTWLNYALNEICAVGMRIDALYRENISGRDPMLNPLMAPTADPSLRAKKMLSILMTADIYAPSGMLAGNRIFVEYGLPFYQKVDGPQLATSWMFGLGWQCTI